MFCRPKNRVQMFHDRWTILLGTCAGLSALVRSRDLRCPSEDARSSRRAQAWPRATRHRSTPARKRESWAPVQFIGRLANIAEGPANTVTHN